MGNGEDYIMRDFLICSPHHRHDLGGGGTRRGNVLQTLLAKSSFFNYGVERGANKEIG